MTTFVFLLLAAVLLLPLLLLAALSGLVLGTSGLVLPSPRYLGRLLFDRSTKRNLGLAHATMNLLEAEHGPTRMAAQAASSGFRLNGVPFTEQVVSEAASKARERLAGGGHGLRLRRRDPASTFLGVSAAWVLTVALLLPTGPRLPDLLIALLLCLLLSGPLGRLTQRWLTTSSDVKGLRIGGCHPAAGSASELLTVLVGQQPAASYWVSTFPATGAADGGRVRVTVTRVEPR